MSASSYYNRLCAEMAKASDAADLMTKRLRAAHAIAAESTQGNVFEVAIFHELRGAEVARKRIETICWDTQSKDSETSNWRSRDAKIAALEAELAKLKKAQQGG